MNMPNMPKMTNLSNCWLIMELMMIMNSIGLLEWKWHDLALKLISYIELGKFMKLSLITMFRELREIVLSLLVKWKRKWNYELKWQQYNEMMNMNYEVVMGNGTW